MGHFDLLKTTLECVFVFFPLLSFMLIQTMDCANMLRPKDTRLQCHLKIPNEKKEWQPSKTNEMVYENILQEPRNEMRKPSSSKLSNSSSCVLRFYCLTFCKKSFGVRKVCKVTITNVCMSLKAPVCSFIQCLNSVSTLDSAIVYTLHKATFNLERLVDIFLNILNDNIASITRCFLWAVIIFGIRDNVLIHYNKYVKSNDTFFISCLCSLGIKQFTSSSRIFETVYSTKAHDRSYKRFRDALYSFDITKNQTRPCLQTYTVAPVFQAVNSVMDRIGRGERVPAEESMRYEMLRLCSFRSYPQDNKPFRIRYAQAGFYYAAKDDEVICYVCRKRFSNWTADDVPIDVHRKESPNCRFLTHNAEVNVPAGSNEGQQRLCDVVSATQENDVQTNTSNRGAEGSSRDVKQPDNTGTRNDRNFDKTKTDTNNRDTRRSFAQESNENTILTQNGFDFQGHSCLSQHSGHEEENSLHTSHNLSPETEVTSCIFPKHPQYASEQSRLQSFDTCTSIAVPPERLSEAGFFFAGIGDCTRCFCCSIGLRHWDADDDAFVEHARFSNSCHFLRKKKGDAFVDLIKAATDDMTNQAYQQTTPSDLQIESLTLTDPAASIGSSNVREDFATSSMRSQTTNLPTGASDITRGSSYRTQNSNKNESTDRQQFLDQLKQENKELRLRTFCSVCKTKEVCIAFLPCGHVVSCEECAPSIRNCICCSSYIMGTVKTYRV